MKPRIKTTPEDVIEIQRPKAAAAETKDAEAAIASLAELSGVAYARKRKQSAADLGMPVGVLDKQVRKHHAKIEQGDAALPHWYVEPYAAAVDGAALLEDIRNVFRRYIALPPHAAEALALWVLHAWTFDAFDISPFVVLVSPTKRCGKTSLLILIYWLTPRSELASNISPSAIFRYIEDQRPCLLIDEADTFVRENEELRGILNSGHTKTAAHVIRNVEINGEHKPRRFSTWAPKAIASIKKLADTLEDRSIIITMRRKSKDELVERRRGGDMEEFSELRSKALRWGTDNLEALKTADPAMPEKLNDRAADNWRPLVAIADLAGCEWPERARVTALALSGEEIGNEDIGVQLLKDTHAMFGPGIDVLLSKHIIENLCADPEKPWLEYARGRPITPKQVARLLGAFGIISGTVHPPATSSGKGYKREQFDDAARRYLTGGTSICPDNLLSKRPNVQTTAAQAVPTGFVSVRKSVSDGSKSGNLPYSRVGLDVWTDRKPENGDGGRLGASDRPPLGEFSEKRDDASGDLESSVEDYLGPPGDDPADFLGDIPDFLVRRK